MEYCWCEGQLLFVFISCLHTPAVACDSAQCTQLCDAGVLGTFLLKTQLSMSKLSLSANILLHHRSRKTNPAADYCLGKALQFAIRF